ncbi:MAG: hypothetical protein ACREIW_02880, partial [Chthoniobacterales bacterium]
MAVSMRSLSPSGRGYNDGSNCDQAKHVDLLPAEVVEKENPIREIMKENRSVEKLAWLIVAVVLAGLFLALPASNVLASTPAEIIQSGLPPKMTLRSAPKRDFLFAVCNAVSRNRSSAP